ncbi:uncharacterized protein LOC144093810 isoform X2 [Amblyomma americanum]
MAWLCNCDDDTAELPKAKPASPQPKRPSKDAHHQPQHLQNMPPSEGELAPEFSAAPPGLEGQSGATIEAGGASSCSRKQVSTGDIIRRANEPVAGEVARKASQGSRRSDKGSVKGDENEEAASPPETTTQKSDSDKHKRHKAHKRHEREKEPCDCPMYEVEVIRKPIAATGTGLPSDKLGMQVVATETVTKRQYTYNMDVDLPGGMRVSPRGKLVEDQGVSAEQGLDGMSPYAMEPYQPPYGQNYPMPQGAALQPPQPVNRYEQYQQQQISAYGRTYGMMQAASYEALAPVARYDAQPRAQPFRADMYNQPPQMQSPQFQPPQSQPPQIQQVQVVQRYGAEPKKVESIVFQCMCGHDQKSTTTSSCTTSKTKSSTTKATGNRTSSTTGSSRDKKSSKSSSTKDKASKGSSSSSKKRVKDTSSSTSSTSSTASSSTKNRKADAKPGFMQVDIHCDRCRLRKTYLVCKSCYSRHKITTCKDCKAPTVREYIRYPSNNAFLNAGARMAYQPELPPQGYGQQQYGQRFGQAGYQEQAYEGAMVQALADKQAGLVVCCSSRTMLPISNVNMVGGPVYQDPGVPQGAVTTNIILLDIMPHEQEEEECATSSSTTNTSTSSVQSPTKSGTASPTKSTGKSRTPNRDREEDDQRGSSLCKCGHDSRTCKVCSEKKHAH